MPRPQDVDFSSKRKGYNMNDKEKIGLKKLQDAFKEINSEELNNLNIPKEDFEFSERYKKNMEKLLAKQRKPCFRYFNTAGKRAVACILIVAMLFASSMTIEAVREPVVEFFVSVYEKFAEIFFGDDEIENSPYNVYKIYAPEYIPDGYEIVEQKITGTLYITTILKNEYSVIHLKQYILKVNSTFDNEKADFLIETKNGITIAVFEKLERKALYWNSGEYAFKLVVPKEFSEEECIKIIESVKELN